MSSRGGGGGAKLPPPVAAYANNSAQAPSKTLAATTAVAVPTTAAALASYGYTAAQAGDLLASVNAAITDMANLQKTVGQLIADLKTLGFSL